MADRSVGEPIPPIDELIAIGIIRKAHGVRGEASVEVLTDSPDRFSELDAVFLVALDRSRVVRARIKSSRAHGERALVLLDVVSSPEALREFQGWTIEVAASEARTLEENEYFIHDLIGLQVVEGELAHGVVEDAFEGPAGLLLSVRRPDGSSFDLPFVEQLCTKIDIAAGMMLVDLPDGLTDLDKIVAVEDESGSHNSRKRPTAPGPENSLTSSHSAPDAAFDAAVHAAPEESGGSVSSEGPDTSAPSASTAPSAVAALTIDVVTIFPAMFEAITGDGVLARAIRKGLVELEIHDLRDFAIDKHQSTDDEAYGGGGGMVMLAEPLFRCLDTLLARRGEPKPWVVALTPQGSVLRQDKAESLARHRRLVLLCGRYEGFDERIMSMVDEEVSVGDFVVTGGELPAMLLIDAVSRMIEGVVGTRNSVEKDSFYNGLLDFPHYTRPAEIRGLQVPEVLLSGHAEKIRQWRVEQSLRNTLRKRPDLLEKAELDAESKRLLQRLREELKRQD